MTTSESLPAKNFTSFEDVFELWERSPDALSSDIGSKLPTTRKWLQRGRIPTAWWHPILETEKAREAGLTADDLTRLAASRATTQEAAS